MMHSQEIGLRSNRRGLAVVLEVMEAWVRKGVGGTSTLVGADWNENAGRGLNEEVKRDKGGRRGNESNRPEDCWERTDGGRETRLRMPDVEEGITGEVGKWSTTGRGLIVTLEVRQQSWVLKSESQHASRLLILWDVPRNLTNLRKGVSKEAFVPAG